jgi:hypothetical protein
MAVIKVKLDENHSKSFTLPDSIIKGRPREVAEKLVRKALAPHVPNIDNAEIEIPEDKKDGAPLVVSVTERATTKGSGNPCQARVLAVLAAAPAYTSPAVALALEAQQAEEQGDMEFVERAERSGDLERAIAESNRELRDCDRVLQFLGLAIPKPSIYVPEGF